MTYDDYLRSAARELRGLKHDTFSRPEPATPGGSQTTPSRAEDTCEMCDGTGRIDVEDPILGDYVLADCPDCGDQ